MPDFHYELSELPKIVTNGVHALPNGEVIRYYTFGDWGFTDHPTEDGDAVRVRSDILAHVAWLNWLKARTVDEDTVEAEDG